MPPSRPPRRIRLAPLACSSLLGLAGAGGLLPAQSAAAQSPEAPVKRVIPPSDAVGQGPAPLLREGGILLDVPGTIGADQVLGVHIFRPELARTGGVRREFVLLPSRGLEDLARIETLRSRQAEDPLGGVFQLTGRVLVYRGRNFLLPESIVPLEARTEASPGESTPASSRNVEDRIADDLEARLESRIGAVPRSLDLAEASPVEAVAIRPGTRFVDRRGHVLRDSESGVWKFVPAGGGGASGLVLLPCLELQRLERRARQRDISEPLLVSGVVTAYRGRNYLLPSAVRAASEGRGIGP